ncbi:STAS-like domain-containing protein [uncultured Deinococcus sp.]|uniref:STAS-like domain-containing protein n=1 Tax=uncultured Deinococcus sp. TaxID=158789 RepID=UPI0025D4BF79|nr:STAS-like domain-containing protein [uncultured Deinococcus sp.]
MEIVKIPLTLVAKTSVCTSSEDGERVYEEISKQIKLGNTADLSFHGVKYIISAFLNSAIGQLYRDYPEEVIRRQLTLSHVTDEQVVLLREVVVNAKKYYLNIESFERAHRQAVEEDD